MHSACFDDRWMAWLEDALREVAETALAAAPLAFPDDTSRITPSRGAFAALTGADESLQLGLLSSTGGCQSLSKLLLGLPIESEDLPHVDVSDAMCEIVNMLALAVKRRSVGDALVLGLPMFIVGQPLPNPAQSALSRAVRLGHVRASLAVLRRLPSEPSQARASLVVRSR